MTLDDIKQKHAPTIAEMKHEAESNPHASTLGLRDLAWALYKIDRDVLLSLDEVLTEVAAAIAKSKPITAKEIEAMRWKRNGMIPQDDGLVDQHNACLDAIIARLPKGEA